MPQPLRFVAFLAATALSMAFLGSSDDAAARPKGACTREYLPVCAVGDGARKTYSNACVARTAGARILHAGPCMGQMCTMVYDPVCARDPRGLRRTYPSLCAASNANATFIRKGACR
jgi:hypothetical protein